MPRCCPSPTRSCAMLMQSAGAVPLGNAAPSHTGTIMCMCRRLVQGAWQWTTTVPFLATRIRDMEHASRRLWSASIAAHGWPHCFVAESACSRFCEFSDMGSVAGLRPIYWRRTLTIGPCCLNGQAVHLGLAVVLVPLVFRSAVGWLLLQAIFCEGRMSGTRGIRGPVTNTQCTEKCDRSDAISDQGLS